MVKFTEVPGLWISILTNTDKASAMLKKNKPTILDGIVSVLFASLIVGVILFLVSSVAFASVIGKVSGGALIAFSGLGYVFLFFMLVIILPLVAVVGLLIGGAFFRLAAKFTGGKGDYSTSTGYLGIVLSVWILIGTVLYLVIAAGQLLGGVVSPAVFFLLFGVAYLILAPFLGLVGGFLYDMISYFEKVSVPRAGMMFGLTMGIIVFIVMMLVAMVSLVVPFQMMNAGGGTSLGNLGWYSYY